jgi:hypothetical protein
MQKREGEMVQSPTKDRIYAQLNQRIDPSGMLKDNRESTVQPPLQQE